MAGPGPSQGGGGGGAAAVMARGFGHLLASQVASRGLTFLLNLLAARRLSPEAYSLATIQFHLLYASVLMLCREGLRRACLRGTDDGRARDLEQVVAVAWLAPALGLVVAPTACAVVVGRGTGSAAYDRAIWGYGAATLIELLAEPLYILASVQLNFKLRVRVETSATVARCLTNLGLLLRPPGEIAPASVFAASQLAYSAVFAAFYYAWWWRAKGGVTVTSIRPRWTASPGRPTRAGHARDRERRALLRLVREFSFQAAEKHVLAEGEKFVLALFQGGYDQGVFSLVANLGSLVVRTVFQPFEEAAFTAFSVKADGEKDRAARGNLLEGLMRLVWLTALAAAAFGPSYSYVTLRVLYGAKWADTDAPTLLAYYAVYVVALAMNGLTEAFVHASAGPEQLRRINVWLVAFSVVFVAANVLCVRAFGTLGLVLAGCVSMAARTVYSLAFIGAHFRGKHFSLARSLPSAQVVAACATLALCARASEATFLSTFDARGALLHLGVAVMLVGAMGACVFVFERHHLAALRRSVATKRD